MWDTLSHDTSRRERFVDRVSFIAAGRFVEKIE